MAHGALHTVAVQLQSGRVTVGPQGRLQGVADKLETLLFTWSQDFVEVV